MTDETNPIWDQCWHEWVSVMPYARLKGLHEDPTEIKARQQELDETFGFKCRKCGIIGGLPDK